MFLNEKKNEIIHSGDRVAQRIPNLPKILDQFREASQRPIDVIWNIYVRQFFLIYDRLKMFLNFKI